MNRMHWLCWHHGTTNDARFRLVANRAEWSIASVIGTWAFVQEHASRADDRGSVIGIDAELAAVTLGVDAGGFEAVVAEFTRVGLLASERVAGWDEQQHVRFDPTNAERQRRHRGRHNVRETLGNDTGQNRTEHHKIEQDRTPDSNTPESAENSESGQLRGNQGATITDLDLCPTSDVGAEAIRIAQESRPGADPAIVVTRFLEWGARMQRPQRGWKKALATFAKRERLSDDERRSEQIAMNNGIAAREPGESADAYAARAMRPLPPEIRKWPTGVVKTMAGH